MGDAWKSPPSDRIGSTINAATGFPLLFHSTIVSSTSFKHRSSSFVFSSTCSSSGYFNAGKGALGQSKAGISSLWIALLRVAEREPKRRPWNPPLKEITVRSGDPGYEIGSISRTPTEN